MLPWRSVPHPVAIDEDEPPDDDAPPGDAEDREAGQQPSLETKESQPGPTTTPRPGAYAESP